MRTAAIASNGESDTASGTLRCATPSRDAIAAQSRLWRSRSWSTPAGSPSERARSIASPTSVGSTSQTRPESAIACEARANGSSSTQVKPKGDSS